MNCVDKAAEKPKVHKEGNSQRKDKLGFSLAEILYGKEENNKRRNDERQQSNNTQSAKQ